MKNSLIYKFLFFILILTSYEGYSQNSFKSECDFYYTIDDSCKLNQSKVKELYAQNKLIKNNSSLNLGFKAENIWMCLQNDAAKKQQVLTVQNPHLDIIDIYFYSNNQLISVQKSGDHRKFDTRYLNHNLFNFLIPDGTTEIIMNISSEGNMLIPVSITSLQENFSSANQFGIFHWLYFGFILLIMITNIILFLWNKDCIYICYALCLGGLSFITALDFGYTFQYFWPNHPEVNHYNNLFYLPAVIILLFTEKLFNIKTTFPKIYTFIKIFYASFIALALSSLFISYRLFMEMFTYLLISINIFLLATSFYFYTKYRNLLSKLFLFGWIILVSSTLIYNVYTIGSIPFNFFFNNIIQIGSIVQIIFLNLAIVRNIKTLKTEKESILKDHNQELENHNKTQDELKKSEIKFNSLINNLNQPVWAVDRNYRLTHYNEKFRTNTKYIFNVDVSPDMHIADGTFSEEEKNWLPLFNKAFAGEKITYQRNFNGRHIEYSFLPLKENKEIVGILVLTNEITERIRHEEKIKTAEKELLEIHKQVAEYKLMALRSVMNPHFLFNSLNSIQYYVAKNERKLALDYLSVFSNLIRKILDSSVHNSIILSDEIEILKYYISLEQLRFENLFDFEINIDPSIDIEETEIPSLLIQPYVENSILHGLINKTEKGVLKININQKEGYLIISVEDNGIGRIQAERIKGDNRIKSKSYGMLLTKERLDIINKTSNVSVMVEDLINEQNEAIGTRINISIKL